MSLFFNILVGGLINQYALTPLILQNESVFYTLTAPQSQIKWGKTGKNNDINATAHNNPETPRYMPNIPKAYQSPEPNSH